MKGPISTAAVERSRAARARGAPRRPIPGTWSTTRAAASGAACSSRISPRTARGRRSGWYMVEFREQPGLWRRTTSSDYLQDLPATPHPCRTDGPAPKSSAASAHPAPENHCGTNIMGSGGGSGIPLRALGAESSDSWVGGSASNGFLAVCERPALCS